MPLVAAATLGAALILAAWTPEGLLAASALVATLAFLALALCRPHWLFAAAILCLGCSPQYLVGLDFRIAGVELSTLQNLLVLCAVLPWLAWAGVHRRPNALLLAWPLLLPITWIGSSWHPELSTVQPFKSLVALLMAPIIFQGDYRHPVAAAFGWCLRWVAPLSVAAGLLTQVLGLWPVGAPDHLGAWRLQGVSIPAHLALLGCVGVLASLILARENRRALLPAGINFAIIALTGTRGALVAAAIVGLGFVIAELAEVFRSGRLPIGPLAALAAIGMLGLAVGLPTLIRRFTGNPWESGPINTSGRLGAWEFFWGEARVNLLFGRGLGASTVANTGEVHEAFRVPHNEYLRLLVDGGVVALCLMLLAFGLVFFGLIRHAPSRQKWLAVAAMTAFAALSMIDNTLSAPQFAIPFWLALALLRDGPEDRSTEAMT